MIYAVGDIHGELDLLDQLVGQIRMDAHRSGNASPKVIFIGDYVDRGPSSREVMDRIISGFEGLDCLFLRGNHEQAMLEVCEAHDAGIAKIWLSNTIGGMETLESYGFDRKEIKAALKTPDAFFALMEGVPKAHLEFIRSMPLTHIEGPWLFVHAGIRPGIALEAQREEDLLWIRRDFTLSRHKHDHIVVHGHSWKRRPQVRRNRIGIDTGAYSTGKLTAVVLEEKKKPRFLFAKR